jgi:hypothetical protein
MTMRRLLIGLPLAGAMMTASIAYAQTPPPQPGEEAPAPAASEQPAADDAAAQDGVQAERSDCVDLTDGEASAGSTEEMRTRLRSDDGAGAGNEVAASPTEGETEGQTDASDAGSASETPPVEGADAGTAPGGSGSSGWTGGLGGSDIGTSQSEELPTSPAPEPPAVASGLDPISGETAVEGPQAPAEPDEDAQVAPASDENGDEVAAMPNC